MRIEFEHFCLHFWRICVYRKMLLFKVTHSLTQWFKRNLSCHAQREFHKNIQSSNHILIILALHTMRYFDEKGESKNLKYIKSNSHAALIINNTEVRFYDKSQCQLHEPFQRMIWYILDLIGRVWGLSQRSTKCPFCFKTNHHLI